jgi:hypothetical protein
MGIPRACGDEPKEVIIMGSNSKITALLGLLMALPITLFGRAYLELASHSFVL